MQDHNHNHDRVPVDTSAKPTVLKRLNYIEGHLQGVRRMVEEDKYCVDVLTQLSSIIAAARSIGLLVLEDHIRGCVINAHDGEAMVSELTDAIERFTKSVG